MRDSLDLHRDFGNFQPEKQRIEISSDLGSQQLVSTVIHEILEALNYHLSLQLEHPKIMILEAALYQVLIDNGVDLSPLVHEIMRSVRGK